MSNDVIEVEDSLPVAVDMNPETTKDFEYSRGKLLELIETGMQGAAELAEVATSSQNSLCYERLGNYLEKMAILQEKLVALSIKKDELSAPKTPTGPQNVTQQLFVGSPAELAELLVQNGTFPRAN